ncbi:MULTISPECIES: DJ-1/PfpI family protein [unclassified Acidocella]|uniref:DJ-1/PfpI family protein n=1 Tax=unclassified Acidocella TaxID=2648610 RepID=UPI00028D95BB|nr:MULTISPECIES: DJ-1/PfpI family protein [unclassified Acidocella]EKM98640.1 cyclohexyl-isocyanide hydratase [Acidocella sp. MX-AZ02]WBO58892.1 DJ-1/PfpI family protein [Acidocella sp. MX-AZ03]
MTNVVIPLYEGVTPLDFTGPYQILRVLPEMDIQLAALSQKEIVADGLTFGALQDLERIDSCDVLLVPGGLGCIAALETPRFLAEIRRLGASAGYVTSVCTGSLILAAAGLLDGRRAACHWAFRTLLSAFGAIPDAGRVVRDGNRISGGGVTAGMDFALSLIAELRGEEAAQGAQLLLEYAPEPPFAAGLPEMAPRPVLEAVNARLSTALADAERRIAIVAAQLRPAG